MSAPTKGMSSRWPIRPSLPSSGTRCSNVDYTTASSCTGAGYVMVPIPAVLADVAVPDGASLVGLRNEPTLAGGRVFVGSTGGHVYMLSP